MRTTQIIMLDTIVYLKSFGTILIVNYINELARYRMLSWIYGIVCASRINLVFLTSDSGIAVLASEHGKHM
jgi:hypothetical protein